MLFCETLWVSGDELLELSDDPGKLERYWFVGGVLMMSYIPEH
jgi:hypothetical protein